MSSRPLTLAACLAAASAAVPLVVAGAAGGYEGRETSSRRVTLEQIPEAAKQALLEQAGKQRIRELEEKVVDGATVYEIELLVEGRETEVVVAPDGSLVRTKRGDEEDEEGGAVVARRDDEAGWRQTFGVDPKNLGAVGSNPYFPLTPGLKLHLSDGSETVVVSVLDETKLVDGVETRVVEEHETVDGELVEISRNYFAIDRTTNDVYYFGEDVDMYEDGKVVSHDGAWLAGVGGAKFGLLMPGRPSVGDRFYLENAPGAVERVEIVDLAATLQTPLRTFSNLVQCREDDVLDHGVSHKWYAPGVGMVGDDEMRVLRIENPEK